MFEKQIKIPDHEEIVSALPMPESLKKVKAERDRLVTDVITGKSNKLLVIVGPCSAHEAAPVLEYVKRLGKLNERVKDKLVLVPRIYTPISRAPAGLAIRVCFPSPTPQNQRIF